MPTLVRHASDSILLTYNQDAHDQLTAEQEELYLPEMPTLNRYVSDAVSLTYNLDAHDQLEAKKEEYVRQFSTCSLLEPLPLHYLGGLACIMMPPKLVNGNTHLPVPTKYGRRPTMVRKSSHLSEPLPLHSVGGLASIRLSPKLAKGPPTGVNKVQSKTILLATWRHESLENKGELLCNNTCCWWWDLGRETFPRLTT